MGSSARTVKFLHLSPHARAVVIDRDPELHHSLTRNIDDVLGVVEKGHVVVIAPKQQNLAIEVHEPIEDRPKAEGVIPRLIRDEVAGASSPHNKPRHVLLGCPQVTEPL